MDAAWPGTFVTESSLLEAIGLLRDALGDDRRRPTYIQTVHRRGYRFIAPTRRNVRTGISALSSPAPNGGRSSSRASPTRSRRFAWRSCSPSLDRSASSARASESSALASRSRTPASWSTWRTAGRRSRRRGRRAVSRLPSPSARPAPSTWRGRGTSSRRRGRLTGTSWRSPNFSRSPAPTSGCSIGAPARVVRSCARCSMNRGRASRPTADGSPTCRTSPDAGTSTCDPRPGRAAAFACRRTAAPGPPGRTMAPPCISPPAATPWRRPFAPNRAWPPPRPPIVQPGSTRAHGRADLRIVLDWFSELASHVRPS